MALTLKILDSTNEKAWDDLVISSSSWHHFSYGCMAKTCTGAVRCRVFAMNVLQRNSACRNLSYFYSKTRYDQSGIITSITILYVIPGAGDCGL